MLMIRLQRVGRKNDPSFRVVIVDSREAAQTGKVVEVVGSHDARNDRTELKAERIQHWLKMGAKASNTVNNLLVKKGVTSGKTVDVSSKKLGKKAQSVVDAKKAADEKAAKEKEAEMKKAEEAKQAEAPAEEAKVEEVPVVEEVKTEEAPVVTEEVAPAE